MMLACRQHNARAVVHKLRFFSSAAPSAIMVTLKDKIKACAEKKTPQFMELKKKHANQKIGEVTVGMAMGGMRGIKGMLTETSDLDPIDGIRYRGRSLVEVNEQLPKAKGGEWGVPEACFWLLLTDSVPTEEEVAAFNKELHARSALPEDTLKIMNTLPISTHPMTQLAIGLTALQSTSVFAEAYRTGSMKKTDYWELVLEDAVTLIARVPQLAALIYARTFKDGKGLPSNPELDWAGNFAKMIDVNDSEDFAEVMRLYMTLHADHEGGNVSAHTTHVVGSALSDPYLAWAAGVCGLAGPLHGLANQECLFWLEKTLASLEGKEPTVELITKIAQDTLASGNVIPGFGHAVLRNTDPRYSLQHAFAAKKLPDDPTFKLANACFEAIPPVLQATGKVKSPWPNVDALSGTLMKYYGLKEADYYTVLFAVSRSIGVMSQLVWSRIMGMPIERPKSVTLDFLMEEAKGK
jgi:citrate synthase